MKKLSFFHTPFLCVKMNKKGMLKLYIIFGAYAL